MINRKTAAIIHAAHLVNNLRVLRLMAGEAKICAVIKADAYGHGVVEVSRLLEREGVDFLAVAYLEEALELREAGIRSPLLVLGTTDPENADLILRHDIHQTVFTRDLAIALSQAAVRAGKPAVIHLKIDTGMHRQGIPCDTTGEFTRFLRSLEGISVEGVYSHFAEADNPDSSFTLHQLSAFHRAVDVMREEGIHPPIRHISNSAALLRFPQARLDMVRPGILTYGLSPDADPRPPKGFLPVMELVSGIVALKNLNIGESVSYGRIFTATRPSRIALLQIGYADGYSRALSNKADVLVRGRRAPVVGRVCMDQILVDVTDIPEAAEGDEVTLFGTVDLPAGELAQLMGTIGYEVICGISKRVPRLVKED